MPQADAGLAHVLPPSLQFLREPVSCLCLFQGMPEDLRMLEDCAHIGPNQFVELFDWDKARGALLRPSRLQQRELTLTRIVLVARIRTASQAGRASRGHN